MPIPEIECFSSPIMLPHYPNHPGVYLLTDENKKVLYVGSSKQLCRRVSHLTALQRDNTNRIGYTHIKVKLVRDYQKDGHSVFVRFFKSKKYRKIEKSLIEKYNPPWNSR